MEEEKMVVSDPSEDVNAGVYPLCFGASCAFVALRFLSRARGPDLDVLRRSQIGELMLRGSAQLMGLLLWRAQRGGEALREKLNQLEMEVIELKRLRAEDAKANDKVVSIYATQEQSWIVEKKKLRLQIQALGSQFRVIETKNEETISNLNDTIEEKDRLICSRDEVLEEEIKKRKESEAKLLLAEEVAEELRQRMKKEAKDHSSELWKHKKAIVELVSNQRQLESEMGRALRQVETARGELEEMFEQKEDAITMVEKLTIEKAKMQKDAEQKDKILSAMLRKSKLDTAEKQMLLKELKLSKERRLQAELEMERWRTMSDSRHRKGSRAFHPVEGGCSRDRMADFQPTSSGQHPRTLLPGYMEAKSRKESECELPEGNNIITTIKGLDQYSSKEKDEFVVGTDMRSLQDWVRLETENYATILEQRHFEEIEAFIDQIRLKEDKLESYHWQLHSMDLESKRLQSHIDELDGGLSQLREENIKLETLLNDRERELKSFTEQFRYHLQLCRTSNQTCITCPVEFDPHVPCSEAKFAKINRKEKEQEELSTSDADSQVTENEAFEGGDLKAIDTVKLTELLNSQHGKQGSGNGMISPTSSTGLTIPTSQFEVYEQKSVGDLERDLGENSVLSNQSTEEEKEITVDHGHLPLQKNFEDDAEVVNKLAETRESPTEKGSSSWKMDLHALGVSYKIKRLKQLLLMLEKLTETQAVKQLTSKDSVQSPDSCGNRKLDEQRKQPKGLLSMVSLLNKQVKRYQSLEEKTNDLCRRMHDNYQAESSRVSCIGRTEGETGTLEQFLEETFQLQRYIVATGQKLLEMQSRITCSFVDKRLNESAGFDMGQFSDIVRTLFREIQRGLELQIARIIGNLEGTLARDGILHRR